MASVRFRDVSKYYQTKRNDRTCAVDRFDLDVQNGELLVLVGPSGCGKTTTLRMVAGLEETSTGTIHIGDLDVTHVAPKDRGVAMVFQDFALYPHMTIYKNLAFGLKMRRYPRKEIQQRVQNVAERLAIQHLLNRRPSALSGGERQRVALGRAMVRKPNVFLLDEPLSNLDAQFRAKMRSEIKSLHQSLRTTMIYVTHDQEEAMTLGDRIVVMDKGLIQQCGGPLEVYDRPANRFVAGFIGTPPMNLFEGRLSICGGKIWFEGSVGKLSVDRKETPMSSEPINVPVVLGIRPEHISFDGFRFEGSVGEGESEHLPGQVIANAATSLIADVAVSLVETLGDRVNVHLRSNSGVTMVARVPSSFSAAPGDRLNPRFDQNNLHLFDADEPGRRLDECADV